MGIWKRVSTHLSGQGQLGPRQGRGPARRRSTSPTSSSSTTSPRSSAPSPTSPPRASASRSRPSSSRPRATSSPSRPRPPWPRATSRWRARPSRRREAIAGQLKDLDTQHASIVEQETQARGHRDQAPDRGRGVPHEEGDHQGDVHRRRGDRARRRGRQRHLDLDGRRRARRCSAPRTRSPRCRRAAARSTSCSPRGALTDLTSDRDDIQAQLDKASGHVGRRRPAGRDEGPARPPAARRGAARRRARRAERRRRGRGGLVWPKHQVREGPRPRTSGCSSRASRSWSSTRSSSRCCCAWGRPRVRDRHRRRRCSSASTTSPTRSRCSRCTPTR